MNFLGDVSKYISYLSDHIVQGKLYDTYFFFPVNNKKKNRIMSSKTAVLPINRSIKKLHKLEICLHSKQLRMFFFNMFYETVKNVFVVQFFVLKFYIIKKIVNLLL